MQSSGQITIRPLAASLQHDVDLFGKMDPYCLVTLGTQQWKSQVCKNGSKTPTWNDEVTFMLQPGVDIMRIALYDDKLIGADKLIAEGVIPVEKLLNFSSPFEEKIPLTFKAKPCGFLQLRIFINKGAGMQQQNFGMQNQQTNFLNQQNLMHQQGANLPVGQEVLIVNQPGHLQQDIKHKIQEPAMVTTAHKTQEFVEDLQQRNLAQAAPMAGTEVFTQQSVQYGPKLHTEAKKEIQQIEKQLLHNQHQQPMSVQPGVVVGSAQQPGIMSNLQQPGIMSNLQQHLPHSGTSMQQPMTNTSLPQCCLSAMQQHNPGFVPGTTGYTGDIPHHQHNQF